MLNIWVSPLCTVIFSLSKEIKKYHIRYVKGSKHTVKQIAKPFYAVFPKLASVAFLTSYRTGDCVKHCGEHGVGEQ